ncbi:DNA alkylation repair protein [Paenibacillus sp. LHD-117]|uniref:DNA alkylation repair protein n=1 Tax=Paenibacillus sp. LHD-117 TaxID=3071412 RepID=UPI0027E0BBF9|nr:DNA alkylation repair protein [Paenibacillus sp. LHD-117]MDQ6419577.1 DNA alkylation repair protein [Paenibacillus sp. LHD-117]
MEFENVMQELETLGKERLKKMYMTNGALEPVYGVATGEMKPMARKIKKDQALAEELFATGNYDAMYFAGVIADPAAMSEADFDRWMDGAYFYMLSDFVVSVTLAEAAIAQEVADKWIASRDELRMSAGWSCYCWLLGNRPDSEFSKDKLAGMLKQAVETIHDAPKRAKLSIGNFIYTLAVSYVPLHDEAVEAANAMGQVEIGMDKGKPKYLSTVGNIQKAIDKGQIGFKRKHVRC